MRFDCRMWWVGVVMVLPLGEAKTFLLPATQLELRGGWERQNEAGSKAVREFLVFPPGGSKTPAAGAVEVPHAGKWRVWVRTKDFANDRPGIRTFTLRLGRETLEKRLGGHGSEGTEGWAWEEAGVVELEAGPLLVALENATSSARCESILFTDNMGYVPEGTSWDLQKERAKVVTLLDGGEEVARSAGEPLGEVKEGAAAVLENGRLRVSFHEGVAGGGKAMGVKVATRGETGWEFLSEDAGVSSWLVVARAEEKPPQTTWHRMYPLWDSSESPLIEVTAGGAGVKTRVAAKSTVPWYAGDSVVLRPSGVRQVDGTMVELEFPETPWGTLKGTWTLGGEEPVVGMRMEFSPVKNGFVSLGFHGPLAAATGEADAWFLPYQFQDERFPEEPALLLSGSTPAPVTLVNRNGVSCALVAEPDELPFEWLRSDRSRYGFGIRNARGEAQPMIYAPVMDGPGSQVTEGKTVTAKYRMLVRRGEWYEAYRKVADEMFGLKDYREPTTFSMTDTVFNLIDLMRNEAAAGWDGKAKGAVQIESRNVVTQASPLTYMSLYLLTGEADLYERYARPSLEYLISRPGPHFAIEREIGDRYYRHQPMRGPVRMYGAGVFASAYEMTRGRSGVFGELALDGAGKLRRTFGGHVQMFNDALGLYRATKDERWLKLAVAEGDRYVERLGVRKEPHEPGNHPFVNNSYAPDWEGLLHLAEVTGEKRFLDAAVVGARGVLATVWTQPKIPEGDVILNPGGVYDHARGIWWWGDGRKRLGVHEGPAQEGPVLTEPPRIAERKVPAWTVSNIGLGMEHPFTYERRGGQANILMSTWAPNFLRLAAASGSDEYRVAARNAMIGRFANYPGYYLDGQTDEFRRADYPAKGPDITSLYVHHIPPFAASVVDFLFTDIEVRSGGQVAFPTTRQYGYVWFDSRLWGHAPGKVYGEEAWPWLHRTAAKPDSPKVDHVLAQGGGKFHIAMASQSKSPERVKVSLDGKVLGREVEGAKLKVWRNNVAAGEMTVEGGGVVLEFEPGELVVLTMDGVKIDVPTQRPVAPGPLKLPEGPVQVKAKLEGSEWEAKGAMLDAPPFAKRDLYVFLDAPLESLKEAVLVYQVEGEDGKRVTVERFPYEFTVEVPLEKTVEWRVEAVTEGGETLKSGISRHDG